MSAPDPARAPASEPAAAEAPPALPPLIVRHLDHLRIQRRLAERTLAMYGDAFRRLHAFCDPEGLELTAVGQITRLWQVTAGLARTNTRALDQRSRNATTGVVTTTEDVRWSPDLTATLWTSYQLDKLTLGLGARYTSEQKRVVTVGGTGNVPSIPSSWVADAMVAYQLTDKVSLRLNIYNLFDKEYISTLNNNGARMVLGAPRSASLTAEFLF